MDSCDYADLENLALAAELARQLSHDFNNYLYNLFLQIEINKASPAGTAASNWDAIKKAGDKMISRLRDWDRFHRRFSVDEVDVDLRQLIHKAAADAACAGRRVEVDVPELAKPIVIGTACPDSRHLLRLLIENIFDMHPEVPAQTLIVVIEACSDDTKALVRMKVRGEEAAIVHFASPTDSLLWATCQAMAVRLGAIVRHECLPDGQHAIEVELPLSMMNRKSLP